LRQFLRASFDQEERALVLLEEELAVVSAYLDIESLRFGGQLQVEQTIDPGLLKVLIPLFSIQPLVENAIQHGLHSLPRARRIKLVVRATGPWLKMSVSDEGQVCLRPKSNSVSSQSARGFTRYRCCADGCKDCSGAPFS
jgi:LytS/YehU family sensor histidine kinase